MTNLLFNLWLQYTGGADPGVYMYEHQLEIS